MKLSSKALSIAILSGFATAAFAVAGYTTVTHYQMTNSLIDSTPIGSSVPATGAFSSVNSSGLISGNGLTSTGGDIVALNSGYLRAGPNGGVTAGTAGFITSGGVASTGNVTVSAGDMVALNGGYLRGGPNGGVTAGSQGVVSAGDVVTSGYLRSGSGGGVTAGSGGITSAGTSNLNTVNANQFNGPLNGNAGTASSLLNGGGSCPYQGGSNGYFRALVSMNAQGQTVCGPLHQWVQTTSVCTASGGSYSTCTSTLNWPTAFYNASYTVVCQGQGAEGPGNQPGAATVQVASFTNTQVTVVVANQASNSGVTFNTLHCEADE